MSACVSPPQDSVSHIVQVAAIIATAASTALPPFWKTIAPAVAARGLPVIASHFFACNGGLFVAARDSKATAAESATTVKSASRDRPNGVIDASSPFRRRSEPLDGRRLLVHPVREPPTDEDDDGKRPLVARGPRRVL